jgi:hypothetical protein
MLVEERIYTLQPGATAEFFRLYEHPGVREAMQPILGHLIGFFETDVGPLNTVVHLWQFADWDERTRVRGYPFTQPILREHILRIRPLIVTMDCRILKPCPNDWMTGVFGTAG